MAEAESDFDKPYNDFVEKYIWLVRPCVDYKNEMIECTSMKGRFHQYFIFGEFVDCSKWSQDSKNCTLCINEKNNDACTSIINNETKRRLKRLSDSNRNDVWKKRDKPPENWNEPLPKYFTDRHKQIILPSKVDEYKEYISNYEPNQTSFCTIL